jgi:hypothetical protein
MQRKEKVLKIRKKYHIRVVEKLIISTTTPWLSLHVWLINSSRENADVTQQRCGRFLIVGLGRGTVH